MLVTPQDLLLFDLELGIGQDTGFMQLPKILQLLHLFSRHPARWCWCILSPGVGYWQAELLFQTPQVLHLRLLDCRVAPKLALFDVFCNHFRHSR
jgi:hypothetical protein